MLRTTSQWALDYDPVLHQLNASTLFVGQRLGVSGKWYVAGGQTYMREPAETTPIAGQPTLGLSHLQPVPRAWCSTATSAMKGLSAAVGCRQWMTVSVTCRRQPCRANYNWDCCGVAFEYSRWAYAPTISQENSYRFSFSLSNIGTFGTIRRLQRLY